MDSRAGGGPLAPSVLVLGIDGAYVPSRPDSARGRRPGQARQRARRARWQHEWRDAKGFRFYLLDGERIVHVLSWHQVQNEEQLGAALKQIKEAGVIPEEQVRLCVICDGAEWIWKHVQTLFPQARQVLDDYHCAQYLHRVAKAHYGGSVQAVEWVEATMTRLYLGKVSLVLRVCSVCSRSQKKPRKRLPIAGTISTSIGGVPTIANSAVGAIRWAVGASNRPTSSFVMYGSSALEPGGMPRTVITC